MVTGVLNTNSNAGIYITDEKQSKSVNVRPGQYLYLAVNDCWVPVVIQYSPQSRGWFFQNLENIDIDGLLTRDGKESRYLSGAGGKNKFFFALFGEGTDQVSCSEI